MRTGPPMTELVLSAEERATLERWVRRRSSAQALALRAGIVLDCARGLANTVVARRRQVSKQMALHKLRIAGQLKRLAAVRLQPEGLPDPLNGHGTQPIVLGHRARAPVRGIARHRLQGAHDDRLDRCVRNAAGRPAARFIEQACGPVTHKPAAPFAQVRDIVGLYLYPPERAVVLCLDEKTQIQALDRSQPVLPMRPGQAERRSHDYLRHGTTSLFAALDAKTGKVVGGLHRRHRSLEFRKFLDAVEAAVPAGVEVHLILDNYSTHKTALIRQWLVKRPHYHVHFTPTGASWINLVERFFALLTEKQIRRGIHRSTRELEQAIRHYLEAYNETAKPFVWTKTADQILAMSARCVGSPRAALSG